MTSLGGGLGGVVEIEIEGGKWKSERECEMEGRTELVAAGIVVASSCRTAILPTRWLASYGVGDMAVVIGKRRYMVLLFKQC